MKHVKLFEQFINEADQWGGIEVPVAKPKRHKIYKKGNTLVKTDDEPQSMRVIGRDGDPVFVQKGDTLKITKVEKLKYFFATSYTGELTINSGPSAGDTLEVSVQSDNFENWKLVK